MFLVVAVAAGATVWVLSKDKSDDASAHEVAQEQPVVSPAQRDEDKSAASRKDDTKPIKATPDDEPDETDEGQPKPDGDHATQTADSKLTDTGTAEAKNTALKEANQDARVASDEVKEKADKADDEDEHADEAKEEVVEAPEPTLPPFDQAAAKAALGAAAVQASSCRKGDDPAGTADVLVTFAPSGRVTSANIAGGPFAGTATGGCVAATLRRAKVPPFSGKHVTVRKVVRLN